MKEGTESLRKRHCMTNVLSSFESLTIWKTILDGCFKYESKRALARAFQFNKELAYKGPSTRCDKSYAIVILTYENDC